GLDEQVIILGNKGDTLDVSGSDSHEELTRLELQIDLVTHIAAQAVYLITVVDRCADTAVGDTSQRNDFSLCRASARDHDSDTCHQPSAHWDDPTSVEVLPPEGGAVSTSGSRPSSTILKPSGFQRRVLGSREGAE